MSSALRTLAVRWPRCPQRLASNNRAANAATASTATTSHTLSACLAPAARPMLATSVLTSRFACQTMTTRGIASTARRHAIEQRQRQQRPPPPSPPTQPSPASSSSSSPKPTSATGPHKSSLDWNTFFHLRLRRRRVQITFSALGGILGGVGGAMLLSAGLAEPLMTQVPLDPFFSLGLVTMACATMGWLAGPSIGSQVFYMLNRSLKGQMMEKESEFFARVRKNRVDPSNSSAGNPVPDFYGEKIQSVVGYRRWLKDQRAFNKKKTANFV